MTLTRVFIENEAGSDLKHHYDEEQFELLRTEHVGVPYPFPYGFVPGTLAPDGDCADCFVLTDRPLGTGTTVEVEVIALLEQTEGGVLDHNVFGIIPGDPVPDLAEVTAALGAFFERFMAGVPDRKAVMGRLLSADDALAYVAACRRAADS